MFGKTAEVVRDYVHKGDPIHIEGRISNRSWEKDGQKQYRTEVIVDSLILLGGKKERGTPSAKEMEASRRNLEIEDSEIPHFDRIVILQPGGHHELDKNKGDVTC